MLKLTFKQFMDLEARLHQAAGIISLCAEVAGNDNHNEALENSLWAASNLLDEAKDIMANSEGKYDADELTERFSDDEEDEDEDQNWWDLAFTPVGNDAGEVGVALQDEGGEGDGDPVDEEEPEGGDDGEITITATFIVLANKDE